MTLANPRMTAKRLHPILRAQAAPHRWLHDREEILHRDKAAPAANAFAHAPRSATGENLIWRRPHAVKRVPSLQNVRTFDFFCIRRKQVRRNSSSRFPATATRYSRVERMSSIGETSDLQRPPCSAKRLLAPRFHSATCSVARSRRGTGAMLPNGDPYLLHAHPRSLRQRGHANLRDGLRISRSYLARAAHSSAYSAAAERSCESIHPGRNSVCL